MMKRLLLLALLFSALGFLQNSASAQLGKGKAKGGPLPVQGKLLADVTIHDESGAEFPLLQKLKGRHAVIVFGCLT